MSNPQNWQVRLQELGERFRVPGAALGILKLNPSGEDELLLASFGVLNTRAGVSATNDSLFQIGSITKVMTATLVMQLVDEQLIDLDLPILEVLPELSLGDKSVTSSVTMRHLLTHTSGIDGDILTDTGRGDDCLERYVATLNEATQVFRPGASWSYCNTGFVIAGRVVEKITGLSWDAAIRERLFEPLGLTHTVTLPEEALLFRAAVGHLSESGADPKPAPFWMLPRSMGPAGLVTSTPADLLAFARMHLCGGLASDGSRILSAAAVDTMQAKHVDVPETGVAHDSWGLGWGRFAWNGSRLIGHDGGTVGQSAFLRILPDRRMAVALLTNADSGDSGEAAQLYETLFGEIFEELANVKMHRSPEPPAPPVSVDSARHLGTYERAGMRIEVVELETGLTLRMIGTGEIAEQLPNQVQEYPLIAVDDDHYLLLPPGRSRHVLITFYALPTGERFVHVGVRAAPRIA